MNIKIVPYIEVNGMRTFSDSVIMGLFDRVVGESLYSTVFYEGTITSRDEFLNIMKGQYNHLYVLATEGDNIHGFVWLNRFEGRTAHLHFCTFKNTWGTGKNIEVGKHTLKELINMHGSCGYFFDLLVGWLPKWNTHAIDFVNRCGAQTAGEIPNAIYNMASGESEPAVFIHLSREDLE